MRRRGNIFLGQKKAPRTSIQTLPRLHAPPPSSPRRTTKRVQGLHPFLHTKHNKSPPPTHHHQPLPFRKNELHWTIPHPPKTQPKTPKPRRPTPTTGPTPIPHASIVWQRQHHCQRSPNRNTTVSHASTNHVLQRSRQSQSIRCSICHQV